MRIFAGTVCRDNDSGKNFVMIDAEIEKVESSRIGRSQGVKIKEISGVENSCGQGGVGGIDAGSVDEDRSKIPLVDDGGEIDGCE